MRLDIWKIHPEDLRWEPSNNVDFSIHCYIEGIGLVTNGFMFAGKEPPNEGCIQEFFSYAAKLSLEEEIESVYIVLQKTKREENKLIPFISYVDGEVEEYCRPPWRQGPGLFS